MGIYVIRVPDIGEGIAEVELVAWHVALGESVKEDQPVADVMTDKASVEIPCHVHGKVIALGAAVGQMISVGAELIRLEVEGEGNLKEDAAPAQATAPATQIAAAPAEKSKQSDTKASENIAIPAVQAPKQASAPVARPAARAPVAQARKEGERPLAAPSVRRRALDMGVDLRLVHGSGPAGQISHADLEAFAAGQGPVLGGNPQYVERHGEEVIPVIGLRRKIA
ncbi:MAG TPA: E3 binding domain-containing protein, partial [Comamonas denitrificans]|nr:E3 binding domain-containing protein [Comamonas denitrificans]